MSTERESILIYGWTGSEKSVGNALVPFAEANEIDGFEVNELGYEITESYSHLFQKSIRKYQKETGYNFEIVSGNNGSEDGEYYFGVKTEYISDMSFENMLIVMKAMKSILDETFNSNVFEEEPKYSNVISWY